MCRRKVTKKYVYHIVRGAVVYNLWWVSPELSGLQAVFFHELQLQQQLELPTAKICTDGELYHRRSGVAPPPRSSIQHIICNTILSSAAAANPNETDTFD